MNTASNMFTLTPRRVVVWLSSIFFVPLICLFSFSQAVAMEQKIGFLPIKITSLNTDTTLTTQVDEAFRRALAVKDLAMLERFQMQSMLENDTTWPPLASTLGLLAEKGSYDHIAVGNLTLLGNALSLDIKLYDPLLPAQPTFYSRRGETLENLEDLFSQIITDIITFTERNFVLASIAPKGNKRIDSGAILRKVKSKSGDAYSPVALKEDLKAIYKMGYFDDVQIDVTDGSKGKIIVFIITEKPVISSIKYTGTDEIDEKDVKAVVTIKEQSILNPGKVQNASDSIKAMYRAKGYYNTKVTSQLAYPTPESVTITFTIVEGKKIYIKAISFEGNDAFDDDDLEDIIETKTKGWFSWLTEAGLLDKDKVSQDSSRIIAHYQNNGYLDAKVGEPSIKQEEEWLYVSFSVEEGSRYKVGTVTVEGDVIDNKQTIIDLLKIRKEEYTSKKIIRDDVLKITDYFAENGYAFATTKPSFVKSPIGNRFDITYKISKGDLVYINRITIKGNTRTRDNVIRRDLQIAEGGIFDSKALRSSTQKLQRLGFFDEVTVNPDPTLDPAKINISVEVKEKSTGQFSIGAGYSSVDKFVVMGKVSENNFLGRGDKLSLSANIGGKSTRYNLGYTNPRFNDSQLSWGIDLFNWKREYDDYTKDSKGGALRVGYPIWEKWRIYGNYSYTDTDLTDVADDASYIIKESQNINITSAIKTTFKRDTTNKSYNPNKGSKNIFSIKYAGGPFGGDSEFTKIEGSSSWFFPLYKKSIFHVKGAVGQVFENKDSSLPVYERFFLGGLRSIRGFDNATISPKDPVTGERIGGDKMWYTNLEVIFPIFDAQGFYGVLFFDAGQVYDDDEDWSMDDIKTAAGVGIRWLSPIGPLSMAWGYNLDPEDDEDQSVWDFTIGGFF